MSIFCSSSSTSGTLASKLATRHVLSFLYTHEVVQTRRSHPRREPKCSIPSYMLSNANGLEEWFFSSLTIASHCHKHRSRFQQPCTFFTYQRPAPSSKRRQTFSVSF